MSRDRRRTVLFWLLSLGALCGVAVICVTLLGASGNSPRNPLLRSARVDGCVTITEEPAACGGKRAWYRVVSEAPGSGRCPAGRRRSESGKFCLEVIDPVEVDVDVDIPPLRTR